MKKKFTQLTLDEKTFIKLGLTEELKSAQVELDLSHANTIITRELKRSGWVPPVKIRTQGLPFVCGGYKAVVAHDRARILIAKANVERRLQPLNVLLGIVTDYLKLGYSPEQIAGTLKLIYPRAPSLQVSHETIYTAIHAVPRCELRTEVVGWPDTGTALWPEAGTVEGKSPAWSTPVTGRLRSKKDSSRGIGRAT